MNLVSLANKKCLTHSTRCILPSQFYFSRHHRRQIHNRSSGRSRQVKEKEREREAAAVNLQDYSEAQQLKFIKEAEYISLKQGIDIWAAPTETLDVQIPYRTAIWSKSRYPGLRERAGQWVSNQTNKFKNAFSMLRIITQQSLPGIDIYAMGFFNLFRTPFQICSASSTKPNSWTAPMRRILLDSYIELQQGLAKNDKKTITKLTEVPYFNEALKLLKKTSSSSSSSSSPTPLQWTFHREISPTKILSIRAIEGHLGSLPPAYGNRLVVHALVRFDTEQSLSSSRNLHPSQAEAQKQRVVEYLIFEKKMYLATPWQVKERLYAKPGRVVL